MLEHELYDLFPRFLLKDRNGNAMARAIDAALIYFTERVESGIALIGDVEAMPEWRLDELAWELDCIYDYSATVERKREWVKNALPYSYDYGTPKAIKDYLEGYFGEVTVLEGASYGLDPYHFMVVMNGTDSTQIAWAEAAIERTKNVRSVNDNNSVGVFDVVRIRDKATNIVQKNYPSGVYRSGQIPEEEE